MKIANFREAIPNLIKASSVVQYIVDMTIEYYRATFVCFENLWTCLGNDDAQEIYMQMFNRAVGLSSPKAARDVNLHSNLFGFWCLGDQLDAQRWTLICIGEIQLVKVDWLCMVMVMQDQCPEGVTVVHVPGGWRELFYAIFRKLGYQSLKGLSFANEVGWKFGPVRRRPIASTPLSAVLLGFRLGTQGSRTEPYTVKLKLW